MPEHAPTLRLRSEIAEAERDYETALRLLRRIPNDPAAPGAIARYRQGSVLLELGRAREAEESLRKAAELDPGAREPVAQLRDLYLLQLRRDELRALLRAHRASRAWQLTDLLDFLVAGQVPRYIVDDCVSRVRAFVHADPADTHSLLALASYYAAQGRHAESAEVGRAILHIEPHHPKATALIADSLVSQGRVDEARALLDGLHHESLRDASLLRSFGRVCLAEGNCIEAAHRLRESLRVAPGDPATLYQLGIACAGLGATTEAAERTRTAQELTMLVDTARQISQLADPERGRLRDELLRLAELMLRAEQYEDARYCWEYVLQYGSDARASELLAAVRQQRSMRRPTLEVNQPDSSTPPEPVPRAVGSGHPSVVKDSAPGHPAADWSLRFEDVAAEVGITFQYCTGDTGQKYLFETLGGGASVLDFDADGWPDLFLPQGCRWPTSASDREHSNALWRNRAGRSSEDVATLGGLDAPGYGIGCAAGDYDNDGFTDLVLTRYGRSSLYHNHGDGTFGDVSGPGGLAGESMSTSAAFADVDRDGDLDLYIANYLADIGVCRAPLGRAYVCHPSMFPGQADVFCVNSGDGNLVDATGPAGISALAGKGLGIVVADLDNDGWPDIYVANDTTPNFLLRNTGGTLQRDGAPLLEECGLPCGAALGRDGQPQAGMGIACADWDDNGLLDLYVTNYYHETNALYLNQGKMYFLDSVRPFCLVAATNPLLGFGTQPIDVDLDGWLDLFVTNGHIDDYRPMQPDVPWKMPPKLYRGLDQLQFADVSQAAGCFFRGVYLGRGVARLDWDRDARPDLVVVHQNDPMALLRNVTATPAHRLVLELVGTSSNRDAANARCWITVGGRRRIFELVGGDGYLASNERRQIIGLGSATVIDSLEVRWPSGREDMWSRIPADTIMRLTEGGQPVAVPLLPTERDP
jgi:Flp pilus assembly protein TadD